MMTPEQVEYWNRRVVYALKATFDLLGGKLPRQENKFPDSIDVESVEVDRTQKELPPCRPE